MLPYFIITVIVSWIYDIHPEGGVVKTKPAHKVKAEDITKKRMYLETMLDVFPKLGEKYIIDSDQKNVLPFLNLKDKNPILPSPQPLINKSE